MQTRDFDYTDLFGAMSSIKNCDFGLRFSMLLTERPIGIPNHPVHSGLQVPKMSFCTDKRSKIKSLF
ncbi:hypothetical protein GGD50_003952 [Rhizobium paranaense]|uniref:Uncharacterized protein n=1 Tax=Rhizobium paranaense TaxID=1650438 RepID=A0A7W8XTH4_9HYPH|nr:hypothetical protein [Rhizobium paranaense]